MHTSLVGTQFETVRNDLSKFGLNPTQWLIGKISLQKEGVFVFFKSFDNQEFQLKGLIKQNRKQAYSLNSLEVFSL